MSMLRYRPSQSRWPSPTLRHDRNKAWHTLTRHIFTAQLLLAAREVGREAGKVLLVLNRLAVRLVLDTQTKADLGLHVS